MSSNGSSKKLASRLPALAIIDGLAYTATMADAFAALDYDLIGAISLNKQDGNSTEPGCNLPIYESFEQAMAVSPAKIVVDLSEAPISGRRGRLWFASQALSAGLTYVGPDFRFQPAERISFDLPSLAVVGTGKRVGKTALSGHLARLLARSSKVILVTMGRGGPRDPVVVETVPSVNDLLRLSRAGLHAASDYLENAALSGVVTVGCRRWGGGIAGLPFFSNVELGARMAAARSPDFVIFEGSGAVMPPVKVRGQIVVAAANQNAQLVCGDFGVYRLLLSNLVVLTMCEEPLASAGKVRQLRSAIAEVRPELSVIATVLRPSPSRSIAGRRVAFFSTAPAEIHDRLREHLVQQCDAHVVFVSGNLARRNDLVADLDSAGARSADLYLTEIKAAAIEIVAKTAAERGIEVVFSDNEVVPMAGQPSIDEHLLTLAKIAREGRPHERPAD